jgi:RNA polymerase sigma-70 factor (ECF subfamily)
MRPLKAIRNLPTVPVALPRDFETLYQENVAFVWRNLRRLGVPAAQTDDACQDVFLVVHRRWNDFAGKSSVKTWLFGIALRVASEHRRKLRRTNTLDAPVEDLGSTAATPFDSLQRRQAAQLLEQFLGCLSETNRPVFILAELEQMTAPEIAESLSLNLNTVYSRLRLARRTFDRAVDAWMTRRSRRE